MIQTRNISALFSQARHAFHRLTFYDALTCALCAAAFASYAYLRARAVGGCDSFAYLADSLLMRGADPFVSGGLDPLANPAVVPLCHVSVERHVVSVFPPGFPALLALMGIAGLAYFTTPVLGALSVGLVYLATRDATRPALAWLLAATWATCPIVIWGATRVMSDLPAATALLGAYVLMGKRRPAMSAAALALAVAIRPASILVAPLLGLAAYRLSALRRFGAALGLGLFMLAAFLAGRFGSPFDAAYGHNIEELSTAHFPAQLKFLVTVALSSLTPTFFLALLGALRAGFSLSAWASCFFVFYAFWSHPFDEWWWSRFILSSLPAWMVLAATGCRTIEEVARHRSGAWARWASLAVTAMLVATIATGLWQSHARCLLVPGFDRQYRDDALTTARLVPGNALVGALNFGGPLRLYAGLETFDYTHPLGLELAERSLRQGRPVYLVAEPWLLTTDLYAKRLAKSLMLREVASLSKWHGLRLFELSIEGDSSTPRCVRLDLGTARDRAALLDGWSSDERYGRKTFVWALGRSAQVSLALKPGHPYSLSFKTAPFSGLAEQCIEIDIDGEELERICLDAAERVYELGARFVPSQTPSVLRFRFASATSPASLGQSRDVRPLAAAFDWIEARPMQ